MGMKRIIQGVSYDTETATEIASGDHGHEMSQAWWTLYRTNPGGAFFEVVAGHDGVVEEFKLLTEAQARRFVEVHANRQFEKHFGSMPARPMRFSRRTLI